MKRLLPLLVLLTGTAVAALPGLPSTDPSKLGADVFALSGALIFVVQLIKAQADRAGRPLQAWVTLLLTFVLAEAASAGLFYARFGATFGELPPPWGWLMYGALAFAIAAGARDFVVALIERSKGAAGVPVTQASGGTTVVAVTPPGAQPGDILPPAGLVQPSSGLEDLPDASAPRGVLGNGLLTLGLDALVSELLARMGIEATPARLLKIGARLALVVPDLTDGSTYLSADSRNRVTSVLMDLKAEGGLA